MNPLRGQQRSQKTCLMGIGRECIERRLPIGYIRRWVDDSVSHHVSDETDAKVSWKRLARSFERKSVVNKVFLIRKLVNMKFKDGRPVIDYLNEFQKYCETVVYDEDDT